MKRPTLHLAMELKVSSAPDPDNYTAYDQVTEAECIAWCKAEMGEEQVTSIEDGLTANIEASEKPSRRTWSALVVGYLIRRCMYLQPHW